MSKSIYRISLTAILLFISLASAVGVGYAQTGIEITGDAVGTCGEVTFTFSWENGVPPYTVSLDFGDGDFSGHIQVDGNSYTTTHTYLNQGDYSWSFYVAEEPLIGLSGSYSEVLTLEGPEVTLDSTPFPPLFVKGDPGVVDFTTDVTNGTLPYTYEWDLNGDGLVNSNDVDLVASAAVRLDKGVL